MLVAIGGTASATGNFIEFAENTDWNGTRIIDIQNGQIVMVSPETDDGYILRRLDADGNVVFTTTDVYRDVPYTISAYDTVIDSTGAYVTPYSYHEGAHTYYYGHGFLQKWNNDNLKIIDQEILYKDGVHFYSVITDSQDNIIIAGHAAELSAGGFGADYPWAGKYDSSGNLLWEHKGFNGKDWWPYYLGATLDSEENIIVGGRIQGGRIFGFTGYYQAVLEKINKESGDTIWEIDPYGTDDSQIISIAVNDEDKILALAVKGSSYDLKIYDSSGNLLVDKINFDNGSVIWAYGASAVGNDFLVGGRTTDSVPAPVVYLVDSGGNILEKNVWTGLTGKCLVQVIKYDSVSEETLIAIRVDWENTDYMSLWKYTPCEYKLAGDLNGDCRVNLYDFAEMAENWLIDCNLDPNNPACVPK